MSSHQKLRNDTTCLNCGSEVEGRFCGNCGQENSESRQTFGHLIQHFFEDITHYEGKFWKTMKYLLFKPAFLTKEYLKGKRMSYVPPVRLYIFISFVTFFLPYILPDYQASNEHPSSIEQEENRDSILTSSFHFSNDTEGFKLVIPNIYKTKAEIDSALIMKTSSTYDEFDAWFDYRFVKMQKYTPLELGDKFKESFSKSLPKALFVYMPLFALVLALFQRKKRWFYFDHALFTIHYFSFLLLFLSLLNVLNLSRFLMPTFAIETYDKISFLMILIVFPGYLFLAFKHFYEESWKSSVLKFLGVTILNLILFTLVLAALVFWAVMSIN
jgi:hypothetical protein